LQIRLALKAVLIQRFPKKNPPHWYKSPEWVLVIVGIVTCIVIGYQSYATWCAAQDAEKAAEATRDSVKLQEIVQQQWVQIDGWRREGEGSYEETPPRFAFAMEVSNPTDVPLTVESVSMTVSAVTIASKVGNVLGPGDPIKVSFPMTIKPDQMAAYKAYRLVTVITGFVVYVDAFKNKKTQPFGQCCTLGPKHYAVFSPLEMPTPQEQNPGQNPN